MEKFGAKLKDWRLMRRLSQFNLANEASISARHISFLETGRARPSRDMVLHLAEVLQVPRAARNQLLGAAGFAPVHVCEKPDSAALRPILDATARLLERYEPYPAAVFDGLWHVVDLNASARRLFELAGLSRGDSLLNAMVEPGWGASIVENWGEVGHHAMLRLRMESTHLGGVAELDEAAAHLSADPIIAAWRPNNPLPPVVRTIYRVEDLHLEMFSTISQFRSAEDIAVAEMHIELMFPISEESRLTLEALADREVGS